MTYILSIYINIYIYIHMYWDRAQDCHRVGTYLKAPVQNSMLSLLGSSRPLHPCGTGGKRKSDPRRGKDRTGYTQDQIASDLLLLESHHSKPVYRVRQVMSGWYTSGWKGQYWGTRKSWGRNQSTSNVPKDKPKEKETNQFPTYDTMVVGQTEQAASAASSSKGDSVYLPCDRCFGSTRASISLRRLRQPWRTTRMAWLRTPSRSSTCGRSISIRGGRLRNASNV